MNLDGRTDLVTMHGGWNRAGIYRQGADGTMATEELYQVPYASIYPPKALAVGDFTGDGLPDVAVGDYNNGLVVLRSAGQVRSWGLGNLGQLGNGAVADSSTPSALPVQVPGVLGIRSLTAGWYHSIAVASDGTTWAWGWNYFGQLGTGTTTPEPSPVQVPNLKSTSASAGIAHTLAVTGRGK